ncbi:hypothetical protein [Actinophytocola xanthii]|uniref:Uncharacterized protein n=1 Tax=Actinophytocola xanthii TaxID=1912961 RepID=A0A1Q8CTI1_9PSEU|nr:hypothetical protein [Actinophytocola xanthii]OLF17650.1 hypothetical protein BU204_10565 [Actinophytocola xanthii]
MLWWGAPRRKYAILVCHAAAIGNTLAVVATLAALVFFPTAALALATVAVGCAIFATLEWQAFINR